VERVPVGPPRTDCIATTDLLDEMLRVADVLVISAALTTATG
jgi:phosphoglycerate dehydrogenase-like enzyme